MRNISKLPEPPSLTQHRCGQNADFENLPTATKNDLRLQLLREQGFLCCYCMSHIDESRSKIEHWRSQSGYPSEQLDYANLLAACCGSEGKPRQSQHCDTFKRDREICFNPARPEHDVESKIQYLRDGTVESHDAEFDSQINNILNFTAVRLLAVEI